MTSWSISDMSIPLSLLNDLLLVGNNQLAVLPHAHQIRVYVDRVMVFRRKCLVPILYDPAVRAESRFERIFDRLTVLCQIARQTCFLNCLENHHRTVIALGSRSEGRWNMTEFR